MFREYPLHGQVVSAVFGKRSDNNKPGRLWATSLAWNNSRLMVYGAHPAIIANPGLCETIYAYVKRGSGRAAGPVDVYSADFIGPAPDESFSEDAGRVVLFTTLDALRGPEAVPLRQEVRKAFNKHFSQMLYLRRGQSGFVGHDLSIIPSCDEPRFHGIKREPSLQTILEAYMDRPAPQNEPWFVLANNTVDLGEVEKAVLGLEKMPMPVIREDLPLHLQKFKSII